VDQILAPVEIGLRSEHSLVRWRNRSLQSHLRETMLPLFTRSMSSFLRSLIHPTLSPPEKVMSMCLQTEAGIRVVLPLRLIMPILMLKSLLYPIRCRTLLFKYLRQNMLPQRSIRLIPSQAMLPPAHSSIRRLLLYLVPCSPYLLRPLLILVPRPQHWRRLHLYRQNIPSTHSIMCHHDKLPHTNFLPRLSYSWLQAAYYS